MKKSQSEFHFHRPKIAACLVSASFIFLSSSGCNSKSSSNSEGEVTSVSRSIQIDASSLLHGFIPGDGQFAGEISPLDAAGQAVSYADGSAKGAIEMTTAIWMKDTTPYQTGLLTFSTPSAAQTWDFKITNLPDGVVCDPTLLETYTPTTDEFDSSGNIPKGNCVYNVEAVAATLPGDLVLLVNDTEVTIPATSAGETPFNIPLTSFVATNERTWLPTDGTVRPKFVTDNWSKIVKRSIDENIENIKNIKYRDYSYTIEVKDPNSPCTITDGSSIMSSQYHSEVSVTKSTQLVTPALLEWHSKARKKLVIDCKGLTIAPTTHDFGQLAANAAMALNQFTLTNTTEGVLTLGAFTTPADLGLAAPFSYANGDTNLCYGGKNLAAGASCTIKVGAYSATAGVSSDSLVMPYKNAANEESSVSATVKVEITP